MSREQRWIILAMDGRHVTLGRDVALTEEEVAQAASGLVAAGHAGWLARLDGDYWARRAQPVLTRVRPVAGKTDAD